mgnify:CR=1 FL=1
MCVFMVNVQYAEQMQFAWHLIRQNIESVLSGDDSLAVQLLPPHLDTGEEEEEMEEEVAQQDEIVVEEKEVAHESEEEVAEQQQAAKHQDKEIMQRETQEIDLKEKKEEEARSDDASTATQPLLDSEQVNENTTSELDLLLGAPEPEEIKSEPMEVVLSPSAKLPTQRNTTPSPVVVKLTPAPSKSVESAPIESVVVVPNTSNDLALLDTDHKANGRPATSVDKATRPVPSPVLRSLRTAVQHLRAPPVLINNRLYSSEKAATMMQYDASLQSQPLSDLPPVLQVDSQLRWTLVLLRDFSVQALLRKQFAMRLRDLINTSCDTTSITVDSRIVTNNAQPGQFLIKSMLPAADSVCRCLFQLCQLSLTYANRLDSLDEYVLRVYIPLVIYHVIQQAENNYTTTNNTTNNTTTASATTSTTTTTTTSAVIVGKSLVQQAKEVLQSVFEQQPTAHALLAGIPKSSCFSNTDILKEFLESIAKHLINMKIQIHSIATVANR